MGGGYELISYASEGNSPSTGTGDSDVALYVESDVVDGIKTNKGKLIYKINFESKRSNFAINTILRNAGVKKEVAGENGQTTKTAITATDVDGTTSNSSLQIQDTAKFFKAKANDGSNLIGFKLLAKYNDSSGASQSEELALNTTEYITTNDEGYQEGNTYQIINKNDSYSKLYWGADVSADANKLIFEIPIELPEQVEVGQKDYNIESFEVSVAYFNENYLAKKQTSSTEDTTEELDENNKSKGITYTLEDKSGQKIAAVSGFDRSLNSVIIPEYVKKNNETYAVTTIKSSVFSGSISVTDVTIGSNVTSIGFYAFAYCSQLNLIKVKSTQLNDNNVDSNVFDSLPSTGTIYVPKGKQTDYQTLFTNKGVQSTWTFIELP